MSTQDEAKELARRSLSTLTVRARTQVLRAVCIVHGLQHLTFPLLCLSCSCGLECLLVYQYSI